MNCMNFIPESLYIFLTLLRWGQNVLNSRSDEVSVVDKCRGKVLSIARLFLFMLPQIKVAYHQNRTLHAPGNTLHQHTRNRAVVELFNQTM